MHALRKCYLFLLIACMTACDNQNVQQEQSPCDALINKLEECIGARPFIRGECTAENVKRLLELSCAELIDNIMGE